MLMSLREYAKHRGVTHQAVQYAIKTGRISRTAENKIDSEAADITWEERTNQGLSAAGKKRRASSHPHITAFAAPGHAHAQAREPSALGTAAADAASYAKARAVRETYQAKISKLEFERMNGALVDRKEVEIAAFNRFRIIRDAVFNIPDRVAAQLAAESDPAVIHTLLEGEVRRIMNDFADGKLG